MLTIEQVKDFQDKYPQKEIRAKFADLLAEYYEVTGNPKKDLVFKWAWEYGHAYDLHEVAMYYDDLVELIR